MTSRAETSSAFEARIVLRPRGLHETFDLAIAYLRKHWRDFGKVAAFSVVPAVAVLVACRLLWGLGWLELWAVCFVLAAWIDRASTVYAGDHLFRADASFLRAGWTLAKRPMIALAGVALAPLPATLAFALGFDGDWTWIAAMLALAWSFALPRLFYLLPATLLESQPFMEALRRARTLVTLRYGRAVFFLLTTMLLRVGFALTFELWARFLISFVFQLGEPIDTLFDNFGSWPSLIGFLAASPLIALARLFDYVDARTRLDGWDIQVRFKAIAARASSGKRAA
jgi:hypothetical protein